MTDKKYLETHEWYSVKDNEITVGISDFAQSELCLLYTSPSPRDPE